MNCIILMGIKHCGKSTQARLISEKLGQEYFDTDTVISELNEGKTPREIYSRGGEDAFKMAETKACAYLIDSLKAAGKDAVIATGGGICNNPEALEILHSAGKFVFLKTEEELAAARIVREIRYDENGKMTNLPAYIAKKSPDSVQEVRDIFHEFYMERVKIYSRIADITVPMINASKPVNAQRILDSVMAES